MWEAETPSDADRWNSQSRQSWQDNTVQLWLPLPAAGTLWYPELSVQSCSWALRSGFRKGNKDFKAVLYSEFLCAA